MPGKADRNGSALLVVLGVIMSAGFLAVTVIEKSFRGVKRWEKARDRIQALYLAESGIAQQLYLEKWGQDSLDNFDTIPSFQASTADSIPLPVHNPVKFQLNPALSSPEVQSEKEGAYLAITSSAEVGNTTVRLQARFGRALSDSIFGSALVISGNLPLDIPSFDRIRGAVRVKHMQGNPAENEFPLHESFKVENFLGGFSRKWHNIYYADLNNQLSMEGGESGNGYFNAGNMPDFSRRGEIFFPLGSITIENISSKCLTIEGPGALYAHGEINIRGCILLKDIRLLAGNNISFEDTVSSENLVAYSGRHIFIRGRSRLDIQAAARENILMEDDAQTTVQSVLMSIGSSLAPGQRMKRGRGQSAESAYGGSSVPGKYANGIHLKDRAVARGLLVASGLNGNLMLHEPDNRVEGIAVIGREAWIKGDIHGMVITRQLRCNENTNHNCIGNGRISRRLMPPQMSLPLDFGDSYATNWDFKLISWKETD